MKIVITTIFNGVNMAGKHAMITGPKHAAPSSGMFSGMRVQPFAGNNNRNLQADQFGQHASGNVNTGFNPATYQGGAHRAGPGGGFNM